MSRPLTTWLGLVLMALACPTTRGQDEAAKLGQQASAVFEKYCYRCHGQNGAREGGFDYVLDFQKLVGKKVIAGDPSKSRLFRRMGEHKDMPPEGEEPRPSEADIATVKKWIEAGAPLPPPAVVKERPFITEKDVLTAIHDHLDKAQDGSRHLRYFTLTHLHNMPPDKVKDVDLRVYRAALSKLLNSLSWKNDIVIPEAVDTEQTVFAIDIRKLDWDRAHLWQAILKLYPYGLRYDELPVDPDGVNKLAKKVHDLAGTSLPAVRADWFIATASRPPLYHTLLQLPKNASDLERLLKVDVQRNFLRGAPGELVRAGFTASGVSSQNRMVERHTAAYGAYWKSYDFKSSAGSGNLFVLPLGPKFKDNPFDRQAFQHAGGEIIFNLPNGLQGYLLVDDKDNRIDAGPIEIVSDGKKVSGTPAIVNGLSCMACHQHGMIAGFKDAIRNDPIVGGKAKDKLLQLYPPTEEMDRLLKKDEEKFLRSLDEAISPFLKVGADKGRDIRDFPEPVSAIARWYISQELSPVEAARELGLRDAKKLQTAIENNPRLQELGLQPLSKGGTIKRETWEFLEFVTSPFQEAARELKQGTPVRQQ